MRKPDELYHHCPLLSPLIDFQKGVAGNSDPFFALGNFLTAPNGASALFLLNGSITQRA